MTAPRAGSRGGSAAPGSHHAAGAWRTRVLVAATVVVSGLLAGGAGDRALVATAAWRHLGPAAWAAYSRQADLGNGLVVYPLVGIGGAALAVAATVSYRFDRSTPRSAASPIYLAALCELGVMATTIKAAPIMLGIADIDDPSALAHAFDQFSLWGLTIRGTLALLGFLSGTWALLALGQGELPATGDAPGLGF